MILKTVIGAFNIKHLILALDDTLVPKYGKNIWGRALHFDHAAKVNLAQYIKGHNWVVLGVLQHVAVLKKWICFPFGCELFIPKKERVESADDGSTKIDISIAMLKAVKEHFSLLTMTLVADALYAKKKLLQWCIESKVTMITRLRSDAALYAPLGKSKKGARGRPAVKGKRLPSLDKMAQQINKFSSLTLPLYGEQKTVLYRQFQAYWKPAGTVVTIVIVKYPRNEGSPPHISCRLIVHRVSNPSSRWLPPAGRLKMHSKTWSSILGSGLGSAGVSERWFDRYR